MRRPRSILFGLFLVIAGAAPAGAAQVATAPGSFLAGFAPPAVVIAPGEGITFTNGDVAPHNFTAADAMMPKKAAKKAKWCSAFDKGRCPLFWSETIATGEATEVQGLDALKSGDQYAFMCTVHPNMKGTLVVR